jgi:hypothetical protein
MQIRKLASWASAAADRLGKGCPQNICKKQFAYEMFSDILVSLLVT